MAFMIKGIIDLKGILFLMLLTIPSQATNLDCYGKAFHCVNSTHFMICVDLGGGISTTIDDVIIPCPSPTVCKRSNRFECEFSAPSTLEPEVSTTANTQATESEVITFTSLVTTSIPFEEYFNTLSTNTPPESELRSLTTDSSLTVAPITEGLHIRNEPTSESVVSDSISTDAYTKPEPFNISSASSVNSDNAIGSNVENNVSLNSSIFLNSTTSVNNIQQLTTTDHIQTRVTDSSTNYPRKNNEWKLTNNITSINVSIITEQSVTTEKVFSKDFQEAANTTVIAITSTTNDQTVTTEEILPHTYLQPSLDETSTVNESYITKQPFTTPHFTKDNWETLTNVTVTDTTSTTNQTLNTAEHLNDFLQPIINTTLIVNASAVTEKFSTFDEVFPEDFQEPSKKTFEINITNAINNQSITTKDLSNKFLQLSINATSTVTANAITEEKETTEKVFGKEFREPSIDITTASNKNVQTSNTVEVLANDLQPRASTMSPAITSIVTEQTVTTAVTDEVIKKDFWESTINEIVNDTITTAKNDQNFNAVEVLANDLQPRMNSTLPVITVTVTEQTFKSAVTDEVFIKDFRESTTTEIAKDAITSATNDQNLNTVEILANDLQPFTNVTLPVITSSVTEQILTIPVTDEVFMKAFREPLTNKPAKDTTTPVNDQTINIQQNKTNIILQPSEKATSVVSSSAVTEQTIKTEEVFTTEYRMPLTNATVTNVTSITSTQTVATQQVFANDFLPLLINVTSKVFTSPVTEQIESTNNTLVPLKNRAKPEKFSEGLDRTTVKSTQGVKDIKNAPVLVNNNKNKSIIDTNINLKTMTNTMLINNSQSNTRSSESLIINNDDDNFKHVILTDIGTAEKSTASVLNNIYYHEHSVTTAKPEAIVTDILLRDDKNIKSSSNLTNSSVIRGSQTNTDGGKVYANDFNVVNIEKNSNDTISSDKVKTVIKNENNKELSYLNITAEEPATESWASSTDSKNLINLTSTGIDSTIIKSTIEDSLHTDIETPSKNSIYDVLRPTISSKSETESEAATIIRKLGTFTNSSTTIPPNTTSSSTISSPTIDRTTGTTISNLKNDFENVGSDLLLENLTDRLVVNEIVLPSNYEVNKTVVKGYNLNSTSITENAASLVQTNEFLENALIGVPLLEKTTTMKVAVDDKKVISDIDLFRKPDNITKNEPAFTLSTSEPLSTDTLSTKDMMNQIKDSVSTAPINGSKDAQTRTNMQSTIVNSANDKLSTSKEYTDKAVASNRNKVIVTVVETITSNPLTATVYSNKMSLPKHTESYSQTNDIQIDDTFTVLPSTAMNEFEAFHSHPDYIIEKTDSFLETTTHYSNNKIDAQSVNLEKISSGSLNLPASLKESIVSDRNAQDMISFTEMPNSATVNKGNFVNMNEEKGVSEDTTHNQIKQNIFIKTQTSNKEEMQYTIEAVVLPSQKNESHYKILENIGESFTTQRFLSESTTAKSPISKTSPVMSTENLSTLFAVTNEDQPEVSISITEGYYDTTITQSTTNTQPSDDFNKNQIFMQRSEIPLTYVKEISSTSTFSPDLLLTTVSDKTLGTTNSDISQDFLDNLMFPYSKVLTKTEPDQNQTEPVKATPSKSVVNLSLEEKSKQVIMAENYLEKESKSLVNIVFNNIPKLEAKNQDPVATTDYINLNLQPPTSNATVTTVSKIRTVTKPANIITVDKENTESFNTNSDLNVQSRLLTKAFPKIVPTETNNLQIDLTTKSSLSISAAENTGKTTFIVNNGKLTTPLHGLKDENKIRKIINPEMQSMSDLNTKANNTLSMVNIKSNESDTMATVTTSKMNLFEEPRGTTAKLTPSLIESVTYSMQTTTHIANPDQNSDKSSISVYPNTASQFMTKTKESIMGKTIAVGNMVKMQTIDPNDQLILGVTEASRSLIDRKQELLRLKDFKAGLDESTVVNTEKYFTAVSPPTVGFQIGTWEKETETDAIINKPDKRSVNMYSQTAAMSTSTVPNLSVRNIHSIEQSVKEARSQTALSTSSPDFDFATEDTTGSDFLVDKNTEGENTHSGIISFLIPPSTYHDIKEKKQKSENRKTETEERSEYSIHTDEQVVTLHAKDLSTPLIDVLFQSLTKDTNYNAQKDLGKKEEMLEQIENNNYESTRSNQVPSSTKINTDRNTDFISTYKASGKNEKRTPTPDLNGNSTVSTNESHTSLSKSKDQNNGSLHAYNITVISNDQSSTPRNISQMNITAANHKQTSNPAFESTTRRTKSNNFSCTHKKRGRYADELDCSKFYVCLGNSHVIKGTCPINTVFSEIRKQCTKNLSHCIRNNQFRCVVEGRFSDFLSENVYYICVKNNVGTFIRFKLLCQNGYHLNKTTVRCVLNKESQQSTSKSESSKNNSDQSGSLTKQEEPEENSEKSEKKFKCKKEGIFADPSNCKRYFECKKIGTVVYRQKRKKCDSGEIFHKDKKKCVDSDSYETYEC